MLRFPLACDIGRAHHREMAEKVHPPVTGSLQFWRAWCREHDGTLKIVHRNPRGVISMVQGGMRHVYHFDKYGRGDGKYSWGSSFPVDFLAQMTGAYCNAHPELDDLFMKKD